MIGREQLERLWKSLLGLGARRLARWRSSASRCSPPSGSAATISAARTSRRSIPASMPQDVSRIGAALNEAGITFDVNADGNAVLVRHGQTAQARMLLAEKGLPQQRQRGLRAVRQARLLRPHLVHAGGHPGAGARGRDRAHHPGHARREGRPRAHRAARRAARSAATASRPRPRSSSAPRSANDFSSAPAIRHLVAAAVPGMTIDQVTVLSTDGTILASGGDAANAAPAKMMSLEKTVGRRAAGQHRARRSRPISASTISRSAWPRASTPTSKQTNETIFDPESRVERSVRVIKETGNQQNSNSPDRGRRRAESPGRAGERRRLGRPVEALQRAPRGAHQLRGELEDDLDRQRRLQDRPADRRRGDQSQAAAGDAGRGRRSRRPSTSS